MTLTPSQELASSVQGRPLLVSAAAGSGKTRVLVERLMRRIAAGENVDEFLVITYTRAAAAELRSRILKEISEKLAENPADRHLRRQTELCTRAWIGTIDSVCGRILRQYVHLTALTPDFRVADEERADELKRSALRRVLEERYELIDEDERFRALADSVGAGRDDSRLEKLVLELYDALRAEADPEAWIERCREGLDVSRLTDAGETNGGKYLLSRTKAKADYWAARLERCLAQMNEAGHEALKKAYGDGFAEAAAALRAVSRCTEEGWDKTADCFPIPMKIGSFRKEDELKESIKNVWDKCRKACDGMADGFAGRSETLLAELEKTRPSLEALLSLTSELDRAYAADKRRQSVVDFSDQEHMVLRLLEDEENGVGKELSALWREVMVDEYQDVNECQDRLFTALSEGGRKLFTVGDVKQSIYRFRLADPTIFMRKYNVLPVLTENDGGTESAMILLRENFRSSDAVLRASNLVFENILSESLGEMDYDEGARLVHGRTETEGYSAPAAEFIVYDVPKAEEGELKQNKADREAAAVAERIRIMVESGALIPDGEGGLRPLRYGDVAILLRSFKSASPRYRSALTALGVPCTAAQSGGFFRSLEITVLLSLLSIIDNPHQDIPLIAVLRSPLYGFTADELSAIRAKDRHADFYTALTLSREDGHCARFLDELEEFRSLAPELPVAELLGLLSERCSLPALFSAMPDGALRRQNLQLLTDYARQFEQSGYKGLFRFVSWMKRLAERGDEPQSGDNGGGNAVQLMSIHRSKGLEYPVVFLCDTARQFNMSDSRETVLIHSELGIASKFIDSRRRIEYPTLSYRALAERTKRDSLSEEMRVLYVAMTRARERLIITAAWPDAEKALEKLRDGLDTPIDPELLAGDRSFSQWLGRVALLGDGALTLRVESAAETLRPAAGETEETAAGETARHHMAEKLAWRYPWAGSEDLPSKRTASALKAGELPDEDAAYPQESPLPRPARRIDLSDREETLSPTERGTAVHLALQFIRYEYCGSRAEIEGELARLRELGHLTEAQYKAVDPAVVSAFFASEAGRRILHADRVYREQRFTLLLPASDFGGSGEDDVLFQGVVDCCIEEQGTLTVIDYKTDYVTEETVGERAALYAPQVRAYASAMERIRGMQVKEGVLYFLRLGKAVRVPLE